MTATRNNAFVKITNSEEEASTPSSGIYEPVIAPPGELVFTIGGDIVMALANPLREVE